MACRGQAEGMQGVCRGKLLSSFYEDGSDSVVTKSDVKSTSQQSHRTVPAAATRGYFSIIPGGNGWLCFPLFEPPVVRQGVLPITSVVPVSSLSFYFRTMC